MGKRHAIKEDELIGWYNLPKDLYYTERNLWVNQEPDGMVRIGFNDIASKTIGRITSIRFLPVGRAIVKDKYLGSVESAKWIERIKAPITGTLIEVNEELQTNPESVIDDPYGTGWFVRIKPQNPVKLQAELAMLVHGEAVEQYMEEQINKIEH